MRHEITLSSLPSRGSRAYEVGLNGTQKGSIHRTSRGKWAAFSAIGRDLGVSSFRVAILRLIRDNYIGSAVQGPLSGSRVQAGSSWYFVDHRGRVYAQIDQKSRDAVRARSAFAPHFDFSGVR